ncbi:hypothetical protein [Aerosakkonema funiforme]|uniref:hypothetical protein n=1 Tax=Aerosakkonema funiforme TaxID=1246630 RepID=UPI001688BA05|nr:hypothetical protein [Aerosakkonema funiforme]
MNYATHRAFKPNNSNKAFWLEMQMTRNMMSMLNTLLLRAVDFSILQYPTGLNRSEYLWESLRITSRTAFSSTAFGEVKFTD